MLLVVVEWFRQDEKFRQLGKRDDSSQTLIYRTFHFGLTQC